MIPVPRNIQVPSEVEFYQPSAHIIFHGKGKKAQRFIFSNQEFSDFENEKLHRLELELEKQKIDPYARHPNWTRSDLLRFCYGTGWKTRVALKVLISYLKWFDSIMPNGYIVLFPKVEKLLVIFIQLSGCMYAHGRDCFYRPIIIVDFTKFDFKKVFFIQHPVQEYVYVIAYFLEYILEFMSLPGKIENWVVISDMGHKSLGPSSISSLKQVMKVLTDNYRCRLGVNYILNPPKTVYFIWSCLKPFMDEVLIDKIKIINNSFAPELLLNCNPYQIEQKFGGKAPNHTLYWPPYVPDAPFTVDGKIYDQPSPYSIQSKTKSEEAAERIPEVIEKDSEKLETIYEEEKFENAEIHTFEEKAQEFEEIQENEEDLRKEKKRRRKLRREKRKQKLCKENFEVVEDFKEITKENIKIIDEDLDDPINTFVDAKVVNSSCEMCYNIRQQISENKCSVF